MANTISILTVTVDKSRQGWKGKFLPFLADVLYGQGHMFM